MIYFLLEDTITQAEKDTVTAYCLLTSRPGFGGVAVDFALMGRFWPTGDGYLGFQSADPSCSDKGGTQLLRSCMFFLPVYQEQ